MSKAMAAVTVKQLEAEINKLDIDTRLKLIRKTEQRTRKELLRPVVTKLRREFTDNPISDEAIRQICEKARQSIYENSKIPRNKTAHRH